VLEPAADGFRNYLRAGLKTPAEELLLDRAQLLTLTAPEMTVLVGGMRALDANFGQSGTVCSPPPRTLTNDFFVNLLDMRTEWRPSTAGGSSKGVIARRPGQVDGTRVDLVFGSNSELRLSPRSTPATMPGEVRQGLRCRVEQGDEPRSLRPRVSLAGSL